MIISTVLSEKPLIEDNSVTLAIVRAGTKAYDEKGKEFTITQSAIDSSAESYIGGIITINHKVKEKGKIASSWQDGEFIMGKVEDLSRSCVDAINSKAYRGVSQESTAAETDENNNILKLQGTGVTFVFYPENPACPLNKGCGVPIASTIATLNEDEDRHDFDVAAKNNTGKLVKLREISVYLWKDDRGNDDILKDRILNEAMFIGAGEFQIFDRNEDLKLGDEIQEELEPVHTVAITVSMLTSFNFPLYTNPGKLESNTPGGVNIADDETTELKSTISKLEGEKDELKSTVNELRQELDNKDSKIESTVQAAVKAALESHDLQLKEKVDMDAAVAELKSCMSEETAAEFLKAEPSVAIIKSTVSAIKAEAGKQVGSHGGQQLNSTDDGGSLSGLYLGGE